MARRLIFAALLAAGLLEGLYAAFGERWLEAQVGPLPPATSATGYAIYYCGDSRCRGSETAFNCPVDCRPRCGDRICSPGEDCPGDCSLSETCGDGVCDPTEDEAVCPADCAAGCGDAECGPTESCTLCPTDCCGPPGGDPVCGDAACQMPQEDPFTCPADCGTPASDPPPPPPPPPVCGDGACELGESPCNCTADCGPVGDPLACLCGNGVCNVASGESCANCSQDCGSCLPPPTGTCGDATCEVSAGESCLNCSLDCGLCPVFEEDAGPPPEDPALQWDGLDPAFQEHFEMDTSSEDYAVPVEGVPGFETATPLASPDGRRDVVYRQVGGGTPLRLNTVLGTWNFWAGGVKGSNGLTVVCWNRLVGADSPATHGSMPDPRDGVALLCAVHDGVAFGAETVVEPGDPAAWIMEIGVNGLGQPVVTYKLDAFGTLINSGQPGDGLVEATFQ